MPLTSSPGSAGIPRALFLGVGMTALATLIIELGLTRLFSVLLYYHFAFMAISVALLGLGAGGLSSYWIVGNRPLDQLWPRLSQLAAANALITVAVLAVVLRMKVSLTTTPSTLVAETLSRDIRDQRRNV